ncbi:MAG: histidine kinase [Cyclobacteriaceae bacterium]
MAKFSFKKPTLDLYSNQSYLKWLVVVISVVIGTGSILYTNMLVKEITKREKRQVDLYAKSLEFLARGSDDLIFTLEEIVQANTSIPVILADEQGNAEGYRNLPEADRIVNVTERKQFLKERIFEISSKRQAIRVELKDNQGTAYGVKYIFYEDSDLLIKLKYYPYIQLSIILVFVVVVFAVFNYSRLSEQNRVWVGLAKETAHQLGTPLSSLMAWIEYLKVNYQNDENIVELDKDINRLEMITRRFSSIGSIPKLEILEVADEINTTTEYLRSRLSDKISIEVIDKSQNANSLINRELFSWVFENLYKNAADAMEGEGYIRVSLYNPNHEKIIIDITDTGKGIPKSKVRSIFKPGFTTKQRGWGLGLALVKRIIENYHQGRIFVRKQEPGLGATFRIILNRA